MDHREFDRLILNGELMEATDVIRKCETSTAPNLQKLGDFIREWMNPDPEIEVQTSGSTGIPKRIKVKKQQMLASAEMTDRFFDFKLQQTALLCLPINYIAGKMMVVRALFSGLNLITVEPCRNPLQFLPKDIFIDFAPLTPMQLEDPENVTGVGTILLGGAPVSPELERKLQTIPTKVFQSYGMTETLSHIALRRINGEQASLSYEPLPGVIFSKDNRGCLKIRVPFLLEELTTNDIVELHGNNRFLWKGRADNVINSGGIKLFPEEIEKKISRHVSARFFVYGRPDESLGQKLVLFIEGDQPAESEVLALKEVFKKDLGRYEQPKEIIFLSHFETTESGKIQRRQTANSFKLK